MQRTLFFLVGLVIIASLFVAQPASAQSLGINMSFSPDAPQAEVGQPFSTTVTVTAVADGARLSGYIWINKVTKSGDTNPTFDAGDNPSQTALVNGQAAVSYTLGIDGSYSVDMCFSSTPTSGCVPEPSAFVITITDSSAGGPPARSGSGSTPTPSTPTSSGLGGISIPNPISCDTAQCLITQVIKYLFGIIAVLATFMFVWGGILMLTSAGNAQRVKQAKETLTYAAIGIVVILLSWSAIVFVIRGIR